VNTFPSGISKQPGEWDFYDNSPYEVSVIKQNSPFYLFAAMRDHNYLSRQWTRTSTVAPLPDPGEAEVRVSIEKLFSVDPENPKGEKVSDYSMRYYFGDKLEGMDITHSKKLIFKGRSLDDKACKVQLALVTNEGLAYSGIVDLQTKTDDYEISIDNLKSAKLVTLPRPYPTFLPYFFESNVTKSLDLSKVEVLQISIGPGLTQSELAEKHAVAIESIRLE
jgi:hypothetical protein